MVHSVILTVYMDHPKITLDMELPCNITIGALEKQLLAELKARCDHTLDFCQSIRLMNRGTLLNRQKTLASYEIWDGQYLKIVAEG